jgi:hypothetical protein
MIGYSDIIKGTIGTFYGVRSLRHVGRSCAKYSVTAPDPLQRRLVMLMPSIRLAIRRSPRVVGRTNIV